MSIKDPRTRNELPTTLDLGEYLREYAERVRKALESISREELEKLADVLRETSRKGHRIYVAGNGGSSSIADHLCCDLVKGTYAPGVAPTLKIHTLTGSIALFTALANDVSYEESFARQIEMLGEPGDAVILISSSGNSPNVIRAARAAKAKRMTVIGFSGFKGGKLKSVSDISLHVPLSNYGMAEDSHQMIMHVLTQYLGRERDSKASSSRAPKRRARRKSGRSRASSAS